MNCNLEVDQSDDSVILMPRKVGSLLVVAKINFGNGKWEDIAGSSGTSYVTAALGTSGNSVLLSYYTNLYGVGGGKVLVSLSNASTTLNRVVASFENANTHNMNFIIGNNSNYDAAGLVCGYAANTDVVPGSSLTSCALPHNGATFFTPFVWDSVGNRWLFTYYTTGVRIYTANGDGSGDFGALNSSANSNLIPSGVLGFTYRRSVANSHDVIYYCPNGGAKIYRYDLQTKISTALEWPDSSMTCNGRMYWDNTNGTVVFSYSKNGLGGIAEIVDSAYNP